MSTSQSAAEAIRNALWSENSGSGVFIVFCLAGLLAWSLLAGIWHLRRYSREARWLRRATEALAIQRTKLASKSKSGDQPSQPILIKPLKEGIDDRSLVGERLETIETLRAGRTRVNLSTLQQLTAARDEAQPGLGIPAFAAGLAMMLGLLGTFIGLAVMIQRIHFGLPTRNDLTMAQWYESLQNLRIVLGGMKTAFSCSLAGMFTAIVASVVDLLVRRSQARFFEGFERFTAQELLPATVPALEDDSLLEQVSFQLERSFTHLERINQQNQKVLDGVRGAQESFTTIVGTIRTITEREAGRDLDRVIDQLAETNKAVLQAVASQSALNTAVEGALRDALAAAARRPPPPAAGHPLPPPPPFTSSAAPPSSVVPRLVTRGLSTRVILLSAAGLAALMVLLKVI
jgi:biopolymer transport protein ExbB/TolQ